MGLDVRGRDILSYGEFIELTRNLDPDAAAPPVLVAWFSGEHVSPGTLYRTLDVDLRRLRPREPGRELIELALRRLVLAFDAFPDLDFPPPEDDEW